MVRFLLALASTLSLAHAGVDHSTVLPENAEVLGHPPVALATSPWWVFLQDRPADRSLDAPDARSLSEDCLERREQRGRLGSTGDWDRPLEEKALQQVLDSGVELRRISRWLNALSVEATEQQLARLRSLDVVRELRPLARGERILPSEEHPPLPASRDLSYGPSLDQLAEIDVPRVHEAGYDGSGVTVLMLDTGYYKEHEALHAEQVIAEWDFINEDGETQNEEGDSPSQHNHGTLTWSALGGSSAGNLYGPAHGASFLLAKTEDVTSETPVEEDNYIAALEWGEALGADVSSGSLGYIAWYDFEDLNGLTAPITLAVDQAVALGMVVCVSAGNYRADDWGHINTPSDAFHCISVGAVDENNEIAWFSSPGPTFDGRIKPEVTARGLGTVCAGIDSPTHYRTAGGTSLSCPLVAGGVALILQAHPGWGPEAVREALLTTADNSDSPNNDVGWGRVAVGSAIEYTRAPQDLVAQVEGNSLRLTWSAGVGAGYEVRVSPQPWGPFDTVLAETVDTEYLHVEALAGGQLFYQVRARGLELE